MKKLYAVVSLCSFFWGYSQINLNSTETKSRIVTDPVSITLSQGFRAASSEVEFTARIQDSNPSNPPSSGGGGASPVNPSTPSGTLGSNLFHDTQGNIEVNGSGQLQFTLPIALPPGVKSVAPQVNLVYTSGAGNGIAGYGWNLSGITSITRTVKTLDRDGKKEGISLTYDDYYSFNGQRLVLVSGEYGKDGAIYTTEKYSNVKIKSVGNSMNFLQIEEKPEYWEVTFEDGSQAWYGLKEPGSLVSTSKTLVEYNITKWKDAQGNYIIYEYRHPESDPSECYIDIIYGYKCDYNIDLDNVNVSLIKRIKWGGNEELSKDNFNEILFTYKNRDLREEAFVSGKRVIQKDLLTSIQVNTGGKQFKKYVVEYDHGSNGTKYQFVKNITEYNSENQPANPVTFEYETSKSETNIFRQNSRFDDIYGADVISGDFDGDGKLDFIRGGTLMLARLDGAGQFINISYQGTPISAGNTIIDNIAKPYQSLYTFEIIRESKKAILRQYSYENKEFILVDSFENDISNFDKLFIEPEKKEKKKRPPFFDIDPEDYYRDKKVYNHFSRDTTFEGDFKGNVTSGFVLKIANIYSYTKPPGLIWKKEEVKQTLYEGYFFIDPQTKEIKELNISKDVSLALGDFNGDGKTDLLETSGNATHIYSYDDKIKTFKEIYTSNIQIPVAGRISGDFNGDGKTDFMVPVAEGSSDWRIYLSSGTGFVTHYYSNLFLYEPSKQGAPRKNRNTQRIYSAPDLNKDGKSDFVAFETQVWYRDAWDEWNNPDSSYGFYYFRNEGIDKKGKPIFTIAHHIDPIELNWDREDIINYSMYGEHYIPIFGNFRIAQLNTNFIILHKTKLITWNLDAKLDEVSRIKSITQGGLRTEVDYKELDPNKNPGFYAGVKSEQYPYIELDKVAQSYAVSQLRQQIPSSTGGVEIRKQDFRYRGFISHLRGKGMIGFRQTARSSWYGDGYENTKVWSGAEIDPIREGLPIKEWSIKTNDEEKIFPKNLSFDNKELLSYKTTEYQIDEFISGNKVTGTKEGEKSQLVTAIVPTKTTTKDFLKEVTTTSTVEYNEHYLPVKTIQNTNQGFAEKITTLEYYPGNLSGEGKDYHIGRPRSKTELVRAYGDSKGAKEEYEYENNQLKTLKTYNRDNSGYLQETYQYDGFGNIIEKKISNSIDGNTQTAKSKYDAQGRFVIEKIDNLGLKTTISYNDWGQVLSQKDPLGNTLTSSYDAWGKLLTATHNLSGTTTHTYEKLNNHHVKTTTYSPDGGISISYTDNIGQNYKSTTKAFVAGKYISKEVRYDVLGRKVKESEPYYEGESASQWNTIEYDEYSRPKKATAFTGKIVETEYTKNTVKATETNANGRFKKQAFDALGNITSTEDKGGVIEFKYNAAGETIEAKYGSNVVTTKYDAWGRKIEFHDPSNGLYRYEYHHGFGLLTKEISPKGYKEYLYNDKGQLIRQIEKANNGTTNKQIEFSYNDKGILLSKIGSSKGKAFSSHIAYDKYGRVIAASEESFGKKYERKNVVYDPIGRVHSYEKSLTSSGKTTHVVIENVYDSWSGELYELKDKKTDKTLWKMYLTNAKGQVVLAQLGNSGIHNTYDTNDFLSNVRHVSVNPNQSQNQTPTDILNISYSFNAIKNELNSRNTTGALNILERFVYDDNNRLVNWTNPVTGGMHSNKYDAQGRIIENDQLGKIKFENSQKVYQPTGVTLNSAGEENLKNQLIQKIEYNENNDPIFIDGVKGDVRFEYGLTEMRQLMSFGGEFLPSSDALHSEAQGKYTRYYSEDGSFEITVDNKTGREKHVLYIGGTPYESNIIFVKDYKEEAGSYKFLHKDYLGSILAISDEEGNKLEQRHYDAWGNLTHLQIGAGEVLTDKEQIAKLLENSQLIIDRGYTSHEHLWEVGVIHMNGRLYDPLLRRFLNADENIQDPHNTQIYNKYGYVTNNPLLYNDPSGEIIVSLITAATVAIISSVATDYYLNRPVNFENMFKSVVMAVISAGVSHGIGEIFMVARDASIGTKILMGVGRTAAHAVSQGVLSLVQGGGFVQGFVSGGLGSLGAEAWGGAMKYMGYEKFAGSTIGMVAFGALSGGVGAELSGGNFWQGAVTGGIVAGLNHAMHKISRPTQNEEFYFSSQKELDEYINKRIGNKARIEKELKTKILLATDANAQENGYYLDGGGNMYRSSNGQMVGGITVPTGKNSSVIYIAPSAKSVGLNYLSNNSSNPIIVHELIHAMAYSKGYSYSEHAASTYSYAYFKAYGDYVQANTYIGNVRKYDPQLSWKKLPSFIKTGLKR